MATCHRGTWQPVDRDINLHIGDMEGKNTKPDNSNESTNGSDTTIAFGGSEADDHSSKLITSNQAKLTSLIRELHDLGKWVEAREGQPAEGLGHIECELKSLSLSLQPQPTSTPTCAEPFGGVICQHIDTLCNTQKQTNITNSLLQDITVFNEYDSTKLEEWLMDIDTAADITNESQGQLAKANQED